VGSRKEGKSGKIGPARELEGQWGFVRQMKEAGKHHEPENLFGWSEKLEVEGEISRKKGQERATFHGGELACEGEKKKKERSRRRQR